MKGSLKKILSKISDDYRPLIAKDSIYFLDVNIGKTADRMGITDISSSYYDTNIIIPLKHPLSGMKVMVDGRTFINYAQLDTGLILAEYVAQEADIDYQTYHARESMIRVFA